MAFHPDRLTGSRARKYVKSLAWRAAPSAPKTLLDKLKRPDKLRAWGRVKAASGKFHYVVIIGYRIVFVDHLFDRRTAARLREMDILGGDTSGLTCSTCEAVLKSWASLASGLHFEVLPADLREAVPHRRPAAGRAEVIGQVKKKEHEWSGRETYSDVTRTIGPDDPAHPAPWQEPDRLHRRWDQARRQNGHPARDGRLVNQIGRLVIRAIRDALPDPAELGIVVKNRSLTFAESYRYVESQKAADPKFEVVWKPDKSQPSLRVSMNFFNWYVRAYLPGRTRIGRWLIMVPGRVASHTGHHPAHVADQTTPTPCDAVDLDDVAATLRRVAEMKANLPDSKKETEVAKTVPLRHGTLFRDAAGVWAFAPTFPPAANRIGEDNQLVPSVRSPNPLPIAPPRYR